MKCPDCKIDMWESKDSHICSKCGYHANLAATFENPKGNRLMIFINKKLNHMSPQEIQCLVSDLKRIEDGAPIVFDNSLSVYQFVDGRWSPIHKYE
jgi:Zn ribbon nucleic-acid-binding protein